MVTYYNRKDLVSFGSYLMSEKRKARFYEENKESIIRGVENPLPAVEALKQVHHADIENWKEGQRAKGI